MRIDRGRKYYGRYTEDGQAYGSFAKFLQQHGIIAQYPLFGSPIQNGIVEKQNRTFFDMVCNIPSSSCLPKSWWTGGLKTAVYILNQVPTKAVLKTPFELRKDYKQNLRNICVWGCPFEVRFTIHKKRS